MLSILVANPLTRYLAIALVAVVVVAAAYVKGRSDGGAVVEAAVAVERAKWEKKVAEKQEQHNTKVAEIAADYNTKAGKFQAEIDRLRARQSAKPSSRSIIKTPPGKAGPPPAPDTRPTIDVYVPPKADTTVTKGFVDLHNTAADGVMLANTIKTDANEPSDKKMSDVATTVAINYYQCNALRAQLEALQDVVIEFQMKQRELVK